MNPTSQPEGSTHTGDFHLDLMAAGLSGNTAAHHWACGMPLSYVQEMADLRLTQHDRATRPDVLLQLAPDQQAKPTSATK